MLRGRQPETLAAMTWIVSNPFVLSGEKQLKDDHSHYVLCSNDPMHNSSMKNAPFEAQRLKTYEMRQNDAIAAKN